MPKIITYTIFMNKQTKNILVLHMLEGKVGTLAGLWGQGDLLKYAAAEFQAKGWDLIINANNNIPIFDPADKSEIGRMTTTQQRHFYKEHGSVSLYIYSSGEIHLWASEKLNDRGGTVGKEKIVFKTPVTNELFWEKLMEAFEKTTSAGV